MPLSVVRKIGQRVLIGEAVLTVTRNWNGKRAAFSYERAGGGLESHLVDVGGLVELGDGIAVQVAYVDRANVRLKISAPAHVRILREELRRTPKRRQRM